MDTDSVKLLTDAGFQCHSFTETGMFFWKEAEEGDKEIAIINLLPDHFVPNSWRSVYIACMYEGTAGEFWYATSNIRGTFRGYRCRNIQTDFDTSNIFASGKTCFSAVSKWLDNYKNSRYNEARG